MERSLFEGIDETQSEEEKIICGYDMEVLKNQLYAEANQYKDVSASWFSKNYHDIKDGITKEKVVIW